LTANSVTSDVPPPRDPVSYVVVSNDELQYSIWPSGIPLPAGWTARSNAMSEDDCCAQIDKEWTDLRPSRIRV
jgi:MbtH protein